MHNFTCRDEARQALIYQLALGLTGKNDMYNYSKAVHVYSPFFDITCSAENYKIALALTIQQFIPGGIVIVHAGVLSQLAADIPLSGRQGEERPKSADGGGGGLYPPGRGTPARMEFLRDV